MKDEIDLILDEALASYSTAEPRQGLETRVMARVRLAGAKPRNRWLPLAVAAAALACAGMAVVLWRSAPARPPLIMLHVNPPPVAQQEPPVRPPLIVGARAASRRNGQAPGLRRLPQREQFPTPEPLTAEERAMVAFARQAPRQAEKLAKVGQQLEIEAIDIRPLEIEGLATGETR